LQATCNQPEAGQVRHRRGCKVLKPQQRTQSLPYNFDCEIDLLAFSFINPYPNHR